MSLISLKYSLALDPSRIQIAHQLVREHSVEQQSRDDTNNRTCIKYVFLDVTVLREFRQANRQRPVMFKPFTNIAVVQKYRPIFVPVADKLHDGKYHDTVLRQRNHDLQENPKIGRAVYPCAFCKRPRNRLEEAMYVQERTAKAAAQAHHTKVVVY